ncbi:MAG TPA: malonic semialdehyde reductase [Polyangia bacterium]|jgi:3-hydroxypropanoate dehydrogenase
MDTRNSAQVSVTTNPTASGPLFRGLDEPPVDARFLDRVFLEARTYNGWLDRPVDEATLRQLYALGRMPPTSANSQPARIVFVTSGAGKDKLRPALAPGNVDKTMSAPVTAIVAYDEHFYEQMPKLFPARPEMGTILGGLPAAARDSLLLQNASLQAGYFILAARALGLDCGPMGGFDKAKVDEAFFEDLPWRATLLINLGYGDPAQLHPRNPRLTFDEACRIV